MTENRQENDSERSRRPNNSSRRKNKRIGATRGENSTVQKGADGGGGGNRERDNDGCIVG